MDEDGRATGTAGTGPRDRAVRALLAWLDRCPEKPAEIGYEYLEGDGPGMALQVLQGADGIARYITGGYRAQLRFRLLCRVRPSGRSERLEAAELLEAVGRWAEEQKELPAPGPGIRCLRVRREDRPALLARRQDGSEDYQIPMTMIYEVI